MIRICQAGAMPVLSFYAVTGLQRHRRRVSVDFSSVSHYNSTERTPSWEAQSREQEKAAGH